MWKNIVEPGRTQMTILGMRIICLVPQTTDTLSEYVKLYIFKIATMVARKRLNFTFTSIACLVVINITSVHMTLMMNSRGVHHIALI